MFWFQFLLVVAVVAVTVFALRGLRSDKSLALKRLIALAFVIAAVIAIIFPSVLTRVANFFGVGRGTDLLLYGFIIIGMLFAVSVIRAKARSDARVTRLARAVALIEARHDDAAAAAARSREFAEPPAAPASSPADPHPHLPQRPHDALEAPEAPDLPADPRREQ